MKSLSLRSFGLDGIIFLIFDDQRFVFVVIVVVCWGVFFVFFWGVSFVSFRPIHKNKQHSLAKYTRISQDFLWTLQNVKKSQDNPDPDPRKCQDGIGIRIFKDFSGQTGKVNASWDIPIYSCVHNLKFYPDLRNILWNYKNPGISWDIPETKVQAPDLRNIPWQYQNPGISWDIPADNCSLQYSYM